MSVQQLARSLATHKQTNILLLIHQEIFFFLILLGNICFGNRRNIFLRKPSSKAVQDILKLKFKECVYFNSLRNLERF